MTTWKITGNGWIKEIAASGQTVVDIAADVFPYDYESERLSITVSGDGWLIRNKRTRRTMARVSVH